MNSFLWLSSSGVMLLLLLLLAVRAFEELLNIRLVEVARKQEWLRLLSPNRWPWYVVFAGSLAVLWLGALIAYVIVRHGAQGFFQHIWSRFTEAGDAPHYLFIAQHGYVSAGEEINNIVFFPLYPLMMAGLGAVLGGNLALAGMIISQVCYGFSAVVLLKLARLDCEHPGAALAAYWLFPFGFFCFGVFTEGLFLLLTILGLYLIRTRRWLLAGVAGFFCALTRTQGVLLLLPGVYCAWQTCRKQGWNWRYLALLCPIAGYGVYLLINQIVCGDCFAYLYYESQPPWWQTAQWIGKTVAQQWDMALRYPGLANWIYWPQLYLYFVTAALLFWGYRRKLHTSHILFGTAYLGMCYTPSWLISGGRYTFGCVPMYLCVGSMKKAAARAGVLLVELVGFIVFYVWFMQGQAIM